MAAHSVGITADIHNVAVVQDAVSEDLSPLIEAHVGGQHRWGMFVATAHELEGQHRAGLADAAL